MRYGLRTHMESFGMVIAVRRIALVDRQLTRQILPLLSSQQQSQLSLWTVGVGLLPVGLIVHQVELV